MPPAKRNRENAQLRMPNHANCAFTSVVVSAIAEFIEPQTEQQKLLMLVNRTWFHGVVEQHSRKPIPTVLWPMEALETRKPSSMRLLHTSSGGGDDDVKKLARTLPQMHHLNLSRNTRITQRGLKPLSTLANLQTLDLSEIELSRTGLRRICRVPSLTSLSLYCITQNCFADSSERIREQDFRQLSTHLTNLRVLNTFGCHAISDKVLESFSTIKSLTSLCVGSNEQITDVGLHHLLSLEKLQELDVSDCANLSDDGLKTISEMKLLRSLNISRCGRVSDEGLACLSALGRLQTLNITNCSKLTSTWVSALGTTTPLEELRFQGCHMSDGELKHLLKFDSITRLTFDRACYCEIPQTAAQLVVRNVGLGEELSQLFIESWFKGPDSTPLMKTTINKLAAMIHENEEGSPQFMAAASVLSALTTHMNPHLKVVMVSEVGETNKKLLDLVVHHLHSKKRDILALIMNIVGNFAYARWLTPEQAPGVLAAIRTILHHSDRLVRLDALTALAAIANLQPLFDSMINSGIFPLVVEAVNDIDRDTTIAGCSVISAAVKNSRLQPTQVESLIEMKALKCLCEVVMQEDVETVSEAMSGIEYFIEHGNKFRDRSHRNPYLQIVAKEGITESLKTLSTDPVNEGIAHEARDLLEMMSEERSLDPDDLADFEAMYCYEY